MINNSKLKEYGFNIDIYKYNTLNLYIRTHFGFDKKCLDDMNFKYENLIYIHSRAAKMLVYGDWAYFSIVIIFFSITNFFSFTGLFLPDLQSLETLIKNFVNFGSSFGLLFYSYYAIDYDDYFEKEMKCSDVITNNNYNIMIYKVNRSGSIITWTFRIYLILFINILISVIYTYNIKLCKKCEKHNIKISKLFLNEKTNGNEKKEKESDEGKDNSSELPIMETGSINDNNPNQGENEDNLNQKI